MEEKGGLNLYGFCANNGVNHWDYLGNFVWTTQNSPGMSQTQIDYNNSLQGNYDNDHDAGTFTGFLDSSVAGSDDHTLYSVGGYGYKDNSLTPPPPPSPNTITLVSKSTGKSLNVVIPGATQDAIDVGVMAAQMTADTFNYDSSGSRTALASNGGGMFSDGSLAWVSGKGSEAAAVGEAGALYNRFSSPNNADNSSYENVSRVMAGAGAVQAFADVSGAAGAASIGTNLKVYSSGWGGNQYVTTIKAAEALTKVGFGMAAGATVWDWYHVLTGDVSPTHASINTAVTMFGLRTGPMGASLAAGYGLVDNLYPGGWVGNTNAQPYNGAGALSDLGTTTKYNQKVVPGWRLKEPGGF